MNPEYLTNPLNRRKEKYKYYLRLVENLIKKFIIFFIILPLSFPFLFINSFANYKVFFKDFFNQNGVVFFVFILKDLKKTKFLIKIQDFDKVLSRFGIFFVLKNFSIYFYSSYNKTLSFKDKLSDYYLNPDYFYYFDKNFSETKNNLVLSLYLPKNYYLKNRIQKYKQLSLSKKKIYLLS